MKMKNSKARLPQNNTSLKKCFVKTFETVKKKKQEENSSSPTSPHNLPVGMVVMGNCSID
jgi:hypothetical protein